MEKEEGNVTIKFRSRMLFGWVNECENVGEESGPLFVVGAQEEKGNGM